MKMKKILLFLTVLLCFSAAVPGAENKFVSGMTARPAALKVFSMPKPVTLDSFRRYLDATALGLNIFELTPAIGSMAVVWQDGSMIKAVYRNSQWQIFFKDPKMAELKQVEVIKSANLTAAFHGTGFIFRTPENKDIHVYGGFTAAGAKLYLPENIKTPAIRQLEIINNALL